MGRIVEKLRNILNGQQISGQETDVQRGDESGLLARGTLTLQPKVSEERRLLHLHRLPWFATIVHYAIATAMGAGME